MRCASCAAPYRRGQEDCAYCGNQLPLAAGQAPARDISAEIRGTAAAELLNYYARDHSGGMSPKQFDLLLQGVILRERP